MSDSPSAEHTTFLSSTSPSSTLHPTPTSPFGAVSHSLTASEISDASYSSAMGSKPGPSRSGATTPITSEEGSAPPAPTLDAASHASKGKQRAEDQAEAEAAALSLLHPNESQATLKREGVEDGVSSASDSTPRNGSARGRSTVPARTEEDATLPHSPSLIPVSSLGLTAPPLQRNMSNSSSAASIISTGGSPVPHTRTPSRTKRRSVGSTFSERLFSLDEEHSSANVDFLALLSTPAPPPLSTPLEQSLLDSLTTLGFDGGQIVHSITTDACDASGAVWWMLKRKADERERERKEAEAEAEQHQSPTVSRQSSARRPSPNEPLEPLQETPEKPSTPPVEEQRTRRPSAEQHLSPPGRPRELPITPTEEERLQYFLHNRPLSPTAGPLLEYFPAAQNSPSRKSTLPSSKSREQLASGGSPESQHSSLHNGSPDPADAKAKRGRAGSVSMLARATSAIGTSLALKKPADGAEESKEDGRASPARGGMFHRKSSVPDLDPPRRASVPNDDYPRSTPPASPEKARNNSVHLLDSPTPVTPIRAPVPIVAPVAVERQGSPSISASESTKTFDTITSSSSRRVSSSDVPAKKGNKLLSNLKMWFVTDYRKRPTTKTVRSPSFGNDAAPPRSLSRSGSVGSRQARGDGPYAASPLARPPLGSRRSSNGSIAPLSRHSSMNSNVGRPKMADFPSQMGHQRRRSDASRKSDSDREHSRPPSVRSFSADGTTRRPHHRHSKAASASSAGSFLPNSSPKDPVGTYRRPPTSTTVRRRHGSATGRGSHSRQRSTSSSIVTRNSSSSSAGEDEVLLDEAKGSAPILEEDETADGSPTGLMSDIVEQKEWEAGALVAPEEKAAARERALRSLSGDYSSRPPHKSSSRLSLNSATTASSSRSHGPVLFTAHKEHHIFGTPSQPVAVGHHSHSRKVSASRPFLRDVFSQDAAGDDEWIDDGEDLDSFGGGLGQGTAAPAWDGAGAGAGSAGADSRMPDSPVAAGLGGSGQGQQGSGLFETGRRAFRAPVMTVEEEEEEEEE